MIDKVDMIRGGMCSSETIAAGKISQANKVFTIAPISSAPEVSLIGDYVYRFYNDTETAKNL
jgi:ABC-type branched-subunit amino acid transport system substrate-binding protein